MLARIHERHAWPGIKRGVVNHIKQCLTGQQTKHPAGNPCFPLQSINSSNFNDLVQFDHLKLCKTVSRNTGLLVIIDQLTKFDEAVQCSHDEYDAQTTANIILKSGLPGMALRLGCNVTGRPTLQQRWLKNSRRRKSPRSHLHLHTRSNGLVERQSRTLLTMHRVFVSRRMQDWDEHIDGVLGAYTSTRHATRFSHQICQHGAEKSILFLFLYPEFAAQSLRKSSLSTYLSGSSRVSP